MLTFLFRAVSLSLSTALVSLAAVAAAPAKPDAAHGVLDAPSVAVLLFREGGSPEAPYQAEAFSDQLCDALGRVPGVRVVSSASAYSFRGKSAGSSRIGAQLGVDYLVEGTLSRHGTGVRAQAVLITAATESPAWESEALEFEIKDSATVAHDVAGAIARHLRLSAPAGSPRRSVVVKPEALRLFYEGRQAWSLRPAREHVLRARELFEKATTVDPCFGQAYAALAEVSVSSSIGGDATWGGRMKTDRFVPARKAVELDPDSAEAHTANATVLWYAWQLDAAHDEARLALRLNPNFAGAQHVLARLHALDGRPAESLAAAEKVTQLDPLSPRLFTNHCALLVIAGRPAESLALAERAWAMQPEAREPLIDKMRALSALGRHAEAATIALQPKISTTGAAVIALLRAGRRAEAEKCGESLPGRKLAHVVPLAALGRTEEALNALDADATQAWAVDGLFYAPELDVIRGDPRFVRYMEQLGLGEAHARAQVWRKAGIRDQDTGSVGPNR